MAPPTGVSSLKLLERLDEGIDVGIVFGVNAAQVLKYRSPTQSEEPAQPESEGPPLPPGASLLQPKCTCTVP